MGGAGRFLVELSEALAERHRVRVLALADPGAPPPPSEHAHWRTVTAPPPALGFWQTRARRRAAIGNGLAHALEGELPDVLIGQHDSGPAVVTAARAVGRPAVLVLPSYEALCLEAFLASTAKVWKGPAPRAFVPGTRRAA